ncbi:MAG: A/G-specific adenine glycosylase [Megasphaera sp.]|jgi:A/G-specific adenine glycosylase|nr:A/G-specific adenine glycosylase [Megasphaera sp.]MCH4187443.1 A/G-specific adenine glycosylase [Megasphaera sp.]MCH4217362.1 A/G-specific adenine glycosylase [Megasphaera sp.]
MTQNIQWAPILLHWFAAHRRDLPWRSDAPRDPYKVWVSEIMLQQTKVEAVRPYYDSWMERFPTMAALAAASQDEVLRQWQGLGYYSRARNLHDAVCEVQSTYGGHVPEQKKDILKLKGIGEYTAGAILSIAYGRPVVAVDGNVLRVFSRLYTIEGNVLSTTVKKEITALAEAQIPAEQAGAFNEALMDFGAMVCIPKSPKCGDCPLAHICQARAAGREQELPLRLTKKHVPAEDIVVVVVSKGPYWLVHRRPSKGLLASMWEFPNAIGTGEAGLATVQDLVQQQGLTITVDTSLKGTLKHVFSHKIWHMAVYEGTVTAGTLTTKEEWQWLRRDEYTTVPWAGPHGKITALL